MENSEKVVDSAIKSGLEVCVIFFKDGVEDTKKDCKLFRHFIPCKCSVTFFQRGKSYSLLIH